jgi:lipopolysaccharide transport system ATP-binding protein
MSDIVIKAENLGKQYHIGALQKYDTLRDRLASAFKPKDKASKKQEDFIWALRDVNFEIRQGEVVGVIGRNGAGKSTLLKILSKIAEPTIGRVELHGRVGSLLEVGTGFHPELTGRENIYLNGAILGMKRVEIKRRFDEIVAFSEVEKFIDTPVKHYSSGMYMRLAFAVAAHLDPEILLVDEVLAVGDAQFQAKCLNKMDEVSKGGRSILFVSHNMAAIQNLCCRTVLLEKGVIKFDGTIDEGIYMYLNGNFNDTKMVCLSERKDRKGDGKVKIEKVIIVNEKGLEQNCVLSGNNIRIRLYYSSHEEIKNASILVAFNVSDGGYIISNLNSADSGNTNLSIYDKGYFECEWDNFNLAAGKYDCSVFCSINNSISDWIDGAFTINVETGDYFKTGKIIKRKGKVLIRHKWTSTKIKP